MVLHCSSTQVHGRLLSASCDQSQDKIPVLSETQDDYLTVQPLLRPMFTDQPIEMFLQRTSFFKSVLLLNSFRTYADDAAY